MGLKDWWDHIQSFLDIDGDIWLGAFTIAIIWKILHSGLLMPDAMAYGSAIAAFAYSNKGPRQS